MLDIAYKRGAKKIKVFRTALCALFTPFRALTGWHENKFANVRAVIYLWIAISYTLHENRLLTAPEPSALSSRRCNDRHWAEGLRFFTPWTNNVPSPQPHRWRSLSCRSYGSGISLTALPLLPLPSNGFCHLTSSITEIWEQYQSSS